MTGCKYGGLNIHPSLLPDLRGAAPLQWTIIHGLTHTGVTLQTLHPSKFDHGVILDQTPLPGVPIPDPAGIRCAQLRDFLAPLGAEMLVKAIRNRTFANPKAVVDAAGLSPPRWAPKITPDHGAVDLATTSVDSVLKKNRAISRLWAVATTTEVLMPTRRVILGADMSTANTNVFARQTRRYLDALPPAVPFAVVGKGQDIGTSTAALYVKDGDGAILCIPTLTVEGSPPGPAAAVAFKRHLFDSSEALGPDHIYVFAAPLTASARES